MSSVRSQTSVPRPSFRNEGNAVYLIAVPHAENDSKGDHLQVRAGLAPYYGDLGTNMRSAGVSPAFLF